MSNDNVHEAAEKKREVGIERRDDGRRVVLVKFDSTTRIHTNYLWINVRYLNGNERKTQTLEVIDTKSHHTARDIKGMIVDTLEKFDIPLDNVLASVTDNATNMVKTIELMNKVNICCIIFMKIFFHHFVFFQTELGRYQG